MSSACVYNNHSYCLLQRWKEFRLRRLLKMTDNRDRNEITEITGSTDSLHYEKKVRCFLCLLVNIFILLWQHFITDVRYPPNSDNTILKYISRVYKPFLLSGFMSEQKVNRFCGYFGFAVISVSRLFQNSETGLTNLWKKPAQSG